MQEIICFIELLQSEFLHGLWLAGLDSETCMRIQGLKSLSPLLNLLVSLSPFSVLSACSVPSLAILCIPLSSLYVCHLVPGPLHLFFFAGCSFCTSQQSGSLITFFILLASMGCTHRPLDLKKITSFANLRHAKLQNKVIVYFFQFCSMDTFRHVLRLVTY